MNAALLARISPTYLSSSSTYLSVKKLTCVFKPFKLQKYNHHNIGLEEAFYLAVATTNTVEAEPKAPSPSEGRCRAHNMPSQ